MDNLLDNRSAIGIAQVGEAFPWTPKLVPDLAQTSWPLST
jgi:hypothetical protein